MIHQLETVAETPRYTQYRCAVCCRAFRVLAGTMPVWPEDCGEEALPLPDPPRPPAVEPTDNCTPPSQVATSEERDRRYRICGRCDFEQQKACAPPACHSALMKNCETGACPLGKWDAPPIDYTQPVPDATDYTLFLAEYSGFTRRADKTMVTTAPSRPHKTRLYAMLSTWHEADIVEAAVRNCFAEGCDRVYLLDNDSHDGTAHEAVKAGAILAKSYTTAYFQDVLRVRLLNGIMREITEAEAWPELWWMCIDCDEMPRGPGRLTVRQCLETLPGECNTVGANAFDHYPTATVANVRGRHPADYQPMGWFRNWPNGAFCPQNHWKHPLNRYRNGKYTAAWMRGLHDSHATEEHGPTIEPATPILMHHFMYRNEADTRARLTRLCGPDPRLGGKNRSLPDDEAIDAEGAMTRFRNLDAIYAGEWDRVRMPHMQANPDLQNGGCPLVHWSTVFSAADYEPRRWYK